MRHLGQGKDIARGEFVPDIPRARGDEVLFLVDLGCGEGATDCARHGIFWVDTVLGWMVGRYLRMANARSLVSGKVLYARRTRCHVFPVSWVGR